MRITDLARNQAGDIVNPWRADLQPASFNGAYFHVETATLDTGRRVVTHEFPKKDLPYSEDMGRRAYEFSVRGYCITYPSDLVGATDAPTLYVRDYRKPRDLLIAELTSGRTGPLILPTMKGTPGQPVTVICPRFRLTEEDRLGGYCVFDMTFVELGIRPREPQQSPRDALIDSSNTLREQIIQTTSPGAETVNV
jgi:hypothetical protein